MTIFKGIKRSVIYLIKFWINVWLSLFFFFCLFFGIQVNLPIPSCNSVSKRLMSSQWPL